MERLISSDSHVNLQHDTVKRKLLSKHHDAYDAAVAEFQSRVFGGNAGQANTAMMRAYTHPAAGRAGHSDPHERLKDMDADGVDAEVLYCEVSAFRFLYLIKDGWRESTRAFNDALGDFGSVDPKRLVVSHQIPIHDIDFAVEEVSRVAALGARSLQLPVFPNELGFPEYFDSRYDPLWSTIQDLDLPICCRSRCSGCSARNSSRGRKVSATSWTSSPHCARRNRCGCRVNGRRRRSSRRSVSARRQATCSRCCCSCRQPPHSS
jgi:predicted TIM-barrel fold metal-dependent hydrolase